MSTTTADDAWRARVTSSFESQAFMKHVGADLVHLEPGRVTITAPYSPNLGQQLGWFHAGVTTSIADSAGGYAAMTLFARDEEVVTTELKINLLRPAIGSLLTARASVVSSGRSLSVVTSNVFAVDDDEGAEEIHVATALMTMMRIMPSAQ